MDAVHNEARKEYNSFLKKGCISAFKTFCDARNQADDKQPDWEDMTASDREELAQTKAWHATGDDFKNYLGSKCIKNIAKVAKDFKIIGQDTDDDKYLAGLVTDGVPGKHAVRAYPKSYVFPSYVYGGKRETHPTPATSPTKTM